MTPFIIIIGYTIGFVITFRLIYTYLLNHGHDVDLSYATFVSFLLAFIWPATTTIIGVTRIGLCLIFLLTMGIKSPRERKEEAKDKQKKEVNNALVLAELQEKARELNLPGWENL